MLPRYRQVSVRGECVTSVTLGKLTLDRDIFAPPHMRDRRQRLPRLEARARPPEK